MDSHGQTSEAEPTIVAAWFQLQASLGFEGYVLKKKRKEKKRAIQTEEQAAPKSAVQMLLSLRGKTHLDAAAASKIETKMMLQLVFIHITLRPYFPLS